MCAWQKRVATIFLWAGLSGAAFAASVTNGSSTLCASYDAITVAADGTATLVNCNNSWYGATFAVSLSSGTTVTSGASITATVTRTGGTFPTGGTALALTLQATNPVTVTDTTTSAAPTFSFSGATTSASATVKFTLSGATAASSALSLSGLGSTNTLAASSTTAITVNPGTTTVDCSTFTRPYTVVDLGTLSLTSTTQDPGNNRVLPANSSSPTQGAFKFTVPSQTDIDTQNPLKIARYFVTMETTTLAASHYRRFGVSQCPGDYSPTSPGCTLVGTPTIAWGNNLPAWMCQVKPGESYYYNIQALRPDQVTPLVGEADGFVLKVSGSP